MYIFTEVGSSTLHLLRYIHSSLFFSTCQGSFDATYVLLFFGTSVKEKLYFAGFKTKTNLGT